MVKPHTLKQAIFAQFTLILLSVAALLLVHTWHDAQQAAERVAMADAVTAARLVVVVLLAGLLQMVWRVARTIYDITQPWQLAVSLAERIADGHAVDEMAFSAPAQTNPLLPALGRAYRKLCQADARYQELEQKIASLAQNQASLDEAQRLAQMGNWSWDCSKPHARWSHEMYRLFGFEPGRFEPTLQHYLDLVDVDDQAQVRHDFHQLCAAPGSIEGECRITTPEGLYRVIYMQTTSCAGPEGGVVRMYGTLQDITERKAAEERMHYLAMYDALTALPNRRMFHEQLEHAVKRGRRNDHTMAVMFIDLDRFKRINDTLGHATGDLLLKEVAHRLGNCVRGGDYMAHENVVPAGEAVARLAGDEFTVTLDALRSPEDAARVAQRMLKELSRPFILNGEEVVVTSSIGIAIYPQDGGSAAMLLKNADAAMYQAKESGKNTYQFFAGAMNSAAVERLKMEAELRHAIERGELLLHYQPQIDVHSGRIIGVEALMRWQHPERGLVPPGLFIPVAEETGLIVAMGEWVLDEACRQKQAWQAAGLTGIVMSINLASPSFRKADLVERVATALKQFDIAPGELCLEATESILMRDADVTMVTLRRLRELGVRLSVDDFGTGYSSLGYLRRFPLAQVKIDRSFVQDVTTCADDAAIIAAIVSLAHTLKLEVVAEGIETAEQAWRLAEQGCRIMQGFYFARPLPPAQVTQLLRDENAVDGRVFLPARRHAGVID